MDKTLPGRMPCLVFKGRNIPEPYKKSIKEVESMYFDEMYSATVIDYFLSPRNVGIMDDADGKGVFGDPGCGDSLAIYIKVENEIIQDISFLVYGCAAAIATSSMTTELAKSKTIEEAMRITEDDIIRALDGLPENKKHCSLLGVKALRSAIENYNNKHQLISKN